MSAIKNKVGRPLKFKTPQILKNRINAYFKWAKKNNKPLTISRMACFLDTTRENLLEYEGEIEGRTGRDIRYAYAIKKAKALILAEKHEQLLTKQNVAGLIFDLKNNANWADKQEVKQFGDTDRINVITYQLAFNKEGKPLRVPSDPLKLETQELISTVKESK